MSLINQMLRDLENRRRNPESREVAAADAKAVGKVADNRRLLVISCLGLLLIGIVWVWLSLIPAEGPAPLAQIKFGPPAAGSAKMSADKSLPKSPVLLPQIKNKISGSLEVAEKGVTGVQPAVPVSSPADLPGSATAAARSKPGLSRQPNGVVAATLLDVGILESQGSSRLVLEFGQLPAYRVIRNGEEGGQIELIFYQAGLRETLDLPQFQGALLGAVSLIPEKQDLLLVAKVKEPVRLRDLQLAADAFHGPRLVLDLDRFAPAREAQRGAESELALPKPEPIAESSAGQVRMNKTATLLSAEEQALRAYRSGLDKLAGNQIGAAEIDFVAALRLNPLLLPARLQQVALLLKTQRRTEAEDLLRSGLQLHPQHPQLRKALARLLFDQGQLADAILLLETPPLPDLAEDLEFHALLAALWQEAGRYSEAADRYEQLLQARPRQALWWLGLAVAREQSGDLVAARTAYRQALEMSGLRPDLIEFVQNRLQLL